MVTGSLTLCGVQGGFYARDGLLFFVLHKPPTAREQEKPHSYQNCQARKHNLKHINKHMAILGNPKAHAPRLAILRGNDPSHHQLLRLDEVGAPSGEESLPHMERRSVTSLEARSCHECPAIVAEHGINTCIVLLFYDPHVECHWSCVGDRPGPARFRGPGLVADVFAADQFGWDILQPVPALAESLKGGLNRIKQLGKSTSCGKIPSIPERSRVAS